jgi:carotenoid cleavage dioxygenase
MSLGGAAAAGNGDRIEPTATKPSPASLPDAWREAFDSALPQHPWLLGFKGTQELALGPVDLEIEGRLPQGLGGTLYRNGPAHHEVYGLRYHHWFDGDGMVQAFRFKDGTLSHRGRLVATQKFLAEQFEGRALYPTFGTNPPNPRPITSPDALNVANISVLPHHGELFALWEAGSPYALDPITLETRGIHSFSPDTRGLPFSAHPRVEPDGTLWNFGYASAQGMLVLWHINGRGELVRAGTVAVSPMTMPHDFLVTSRHLVVMLPPLDFEPKPGATFLDSHVWHPEQPTRVLVVDKNDFTQTAWYELPAQWVFHYGNAWEDRPGVIRFDGARSADPAAVLQGFRSVMRGDAPAQGDSRHHLYRIDTRRKTIAETPLIAADRSSEFPAIDPRVSTQRNRRIVVLSANRKDKSPHPLFDAVSVLDVDTGAEATYRYPSHQMPEEHLFVPAPDSAAESKGWLVGTFLDLQRGTTRLNVFDVEAVASGPVATATLPYVIPLGLHGKFVFGWFTSPRRASACHSPRSQARWRCALRLRCW